MKALVIAALIGLGVYTWTTWKPAADSIAAGIMFNDVITHKGTVYESDWADESVEITGQLRRRDRHYDQSMPIVTYDMVITSGEFSDPDIVKLRHKGGGNYFWSSQKTPEGSLVVYPPSP